MATDINGAKVRLYLDGNNEPATTKSAEWEERLENLPERTINAGGLTLSGCAVEDIPLHQESFEYYMRRGKKHYFRGVENKIVVEINDQSVFANLKYHDSVNFNWEAADSDTQKIIDEGFGQLALKNMGRAVHQLLNEIKKDNESKS